MILWISLRPRQLPSKQSPNHFWRSPTLFQQQMGLGPLFAHWAAAWHLNGSRLTNMEARTPPCNGMQCSPILYLKLIVCRSNGTIVSPSEVEALLPLSKRWGWQSPNLELVTFSISHFRVGDAGFQAGFMDAVSSAILCVISYHTCLF